MSTTIQEYSPMTVGDATFAEKQRQAADMAGAQDMLRLFVSRHGTKREFSAVTKAIKAHFANPQNGDRANV